jgi:peptidoglycan-N-acetylmuramic acid deacetylase
MKRKTTGLTAVILSIAVAAIAFTAIAPKTAGVPASAGAPMSAESGDGTISWGLYAPRGGVTPQAPKGGPELLQKYDGLFMGKENEKKVYFTFDLGYEAGHTGAVLDILKNNGVRAVFFICGHYLLTERKLLDRMHAEGHEVGNHTDKHKDLPAIGIPAASEDINALKRNFEAKYGRRMRFFRPPQGRFNENVLRLAKDQGLRAVLWSVAIRDWERSPELNYVKCAETFLSRIHPGAVILFHITNPGTPKMLELLIPQILEKGYTIGTPDELK